jgi:hypothetical protein
LFDLTNDYENKINHFNAEFKIKLEELMDVKNKQNIINKKYDQFKIDHEILIKNMENSNNIIKNNENEIKLQTENILIQANKINDYENIIKLKNIVIIDLENSIKYKSAE